MPPICGRRPSDRPMPGRRRASWPLRWCSMGSAARRRRGFAGWTAKHPHGALPHDVLLEHLRDGVHRYNKAGLEGLADRARSGRPAGLSWVEQGKFASWIEEGADLTGDGAVRFRRADLRDRIATGFGVELHERSVGKLLWRLDFRRLSVRPQHPQTDPAAQEAFKKTSQP